MIYLYDILDKCPHLSHLYLNDMDIDQQAMVQINKDLEGYRAISKCWILVLIKSTVLV